MTASTDRSPDDVTAPAPSPVVPVPGVREPAPGQRRKDLPRCSDTARARCDPLTATAAPARRWLLVEHPGPWAPDALGGSGVHEDVIARLGAASRSAGGRILLVRRPGRAGRSAEVPADGGPALTWAVVDHASGRTTSGRWAGGQGWDLLAAAAAMAAPSRAEPAPVAAAPLLLVCAHARHDTCCAVRGLPVAAALAREWPEQTWECSHVGGDRFAANVVVVPDGAYYGGLDPDSAVAAVRRHLAGVVDTRYLRGTTTAPPVVQAAVTAALERFGPAALHDVRGDGVEPAGEDRWRVRLVGTGPVPPSLLATVRRTRRPPARLTCRAPMDSAAADHEVLDLVVRS